MWRGWLFWQNAEVGLEPSRGAKWGVEVKFGKASSIIWFPLLELLIEVGILRAAIQGEGLRFWQIALKVGFHLLEIDSWNQDTT